MDGNINTKKLITILVCIALAFGIFGCVVGIIMRRPGGSGSHNNKNDNNQYLFISAGEGTDKIKTQVLLELDGNIVKYAVFSENFKNISKDDVVGMVDKEAISDILNDIKEEKLFFGSDLGLELSSGLQKRDEEFRLAFTDLRDVLFADMKVKFNITADNNKFSTMIEEAKKIDPIKVSSGEEFANVLSSHNNILLTDNVSSSVDYTLGEREITIDCDGHDLKLSGVLKVYDEGMKLIVVNASKVDVTELKIDNQVVLDNEDGVTVIEFMMNESNVKFMDGLGSGNKGILKKTDKESSKIYIMK